MQDREGSPLPSSFTWILVDLCILPPGSCTELPPWYLCMQSKQESPQDVSIAFYNLISEKTSPHWYYILFFRVGLLHTIYLQKQGITPGGVNHYGPSQSLLTSHIYICVKLLLVLLYITKYFSNINPINMFLNWK